MLEVYQWLNELAPGQLMDDSSMVAENLDICSLLEIPKHSINSRNKCGQTLLIRSIFLENVDLRIKMVNALISADCDVSAVDAYKRNTLMWACLYRRDAEVKILLEVGTAIDLLQTDIQGNTALHYAVTSGSAGIVKSVRDHMIERNIDLSPSNLDGITPKMQAKRLGFDVCQSILSKDIEKVTECCEDYRHHERPGSSRSSNVVSLPPIISPEIKNRMDFLELKACNDIGIPNSTKLLIDLFENDSPPVVDCTKSCTSSELRKSLPKLTVTSKRARQSKKKHPSQRRKLSKSLSFPAL